MRIQTDNFGFNEAFRCRLHENSYNYPAHLHQFTEFAIILDGELEITVNDNKRVAKQGDIAVISPFAVHSFSTPKYCKIWIAVFSDTYILDFNIQHGLHKKDFIFTPTKSLFNYVEEHFINMPEINLHSIRACVYTLLEEYSRFVPSEEQKKRKTRHSCRYFQIYEQQLQRKHLIENSCSRAELQYVVCFKNAIRCSQY